MTKREIGTGQEGITVLTLLLAVFAVAIFAVAIPTYLMSQRSASDGVAQQRAAQALATQKQFQTQEGAYADASELSEAAPALDVRPLTEGEEPEVLGAVYVKTETGVVSLVTRSSSGRCFWIRETAGRTEYAQASCGTPAESLEFKDGW